MATSILSGTVDLICVLPQVKSCKDFLSFLGVWKTMACQFFYCFINTPAQNALIQLWEIKNYVFFLYLRLASQKISMTKMLVSTASWKINKSFLSVVTCPAGTFYNPTTKTCDWVPVGHFQNLTGQADYTACPENTTTETFGATSENECIGKY